MLVMIDEEESTSESPKNNDGVDDEAETLQGDNEKVGQGGS